MEGSDKKKQPGKLDAGRFKAFQPECDSKDLGLQGPPKPPRDLDKAFQVYMEKLKVFKEPVQLIAADETKHLRFSEDAVSELMQINHPVNVVSVVGKYRTGKSLLLNRLARKHKAFEVGSSHNAMTKGIWIFCLPHPTQKSQVLVLLDTEGLDDAAKDNTIEERWYFVLVTLLSSTLVYNHKGTLDAGAIKKLKFLKNIKTTINVLDSKRADDSVFDVFFPVFVIAVRDNHLEVIDENKESISPDQFLENTLTLKTGANEYIRKYNEPRVLVRKYFKERKCFMICPPRYPERLDEGSIPQNKNFEGDVELFINYINCCKPKRMASGKVITGRMFGSLVCSYTRHIQDERNPCLHEAAKEMINFENQNTVRDAENVYRKEMQKLIGENMPGSEDMAKHDEQCMEKAIEYLRCNIIYEDFHLFLDTAKLSCDEERDVLSCDIRKEFDQNPPYETIDSFFEILNALKKSIAKDSESACRKKLDTLNRQRIGKKLKMQTYVHPAGYDEYMKDIDWIIKQYNKTTGLGPKMRSILQEYIDGKEEEEEEIYQMVLKAQGDIRREGEEKMPEPIKRPLPRQLAKEEEAESNSEHGSYISDDLLKRIIEDQQLQRKDMSENFFALMKLKVAEYERQLGEGAESSAAVTKEENDRFKENFLTGTTEQPIGPRPAPSGEEKRHPQPNSKSCELL